MERRFLSVKSAPVLIETRDGPDGKPKQTLTGYAACFYDAADPGTQYEMKGWMTMRERIMPGAFDRALREDDVRALFNHDPNHILGRTASGTCRLSVDRKGLRYEIDPPDTNSARDLMESIKRGDITGSSFAFKATDTVWRDLMEDDEEVTIREIHGAKLFDVSPVTYPAYTSTSADVRAADGIDLERLKAEHDAFRAGQTPADLPAKLAQYQRRARVVALDR